jgi:hypothetical protein
MRHRIGDRGGQGWLAYFHFQDFHFIVCLLRPGVSESAIDVARARLAYFHFQDFHFMV